MVYSQRFVVCVLVNGQIQKEHGDNTVFLPFGSEYALRFRNKHKDRTAVVKLFIDGEEQSKGGYVIPPNSYKDIERNSFSPHKFKFVPADSTEAQNFGKDKNNTERYNGVVEARFYLEEKPTNVIHHHHHHYDYDDDYLPRPYRRRKNHPYEITWQSKSANAYLNESLSSPFPANADSLKNGSLSARKREPIAGVTVEGSMSNQTFTKVDIQLEEQFVSVKVFLRGYHEEEHIEEAEVTSNVSLSKKDLKAAARQESGATAYCPNCGANRKPINANFCHVCGHKY